MVSSITLERTIDILADHAYGPGITLVELRALHPTEVRRVALLEALRHLEAMDLVRWRKDRVWWLGPIPDDARPLGIRVARARRLRRMTPRQGVERWFALRASAPTARRGR